MTGALCLVLAALAALAARAEGWGLVDSSLGAARITTPAASAVLLARRYGCSPTTDEAFCRLAVNGTVGESTNSTLVCLGPTRSAALSREAIADVYAMVADSPLYCPVGPHNFMNTLQYGPFLGPFPANISIDSWAFADVAPDLPCVHYDTGAVVGFTGCAVRVSLTTSRAWIRVAQAPQLVSVNEAPVGAPLFSSPSTTLVMTDTALRLVLDGAIVRWIPTLITLTIL